jgi:glutaredoxin-related protein
LTKDIVETLELFQGQLTYTEIVELIPLKELLRMRDARIELNKKKQEMIDNMSNPNQQKVSLEDMVKIKNVDTITNKLERSK